MTKQQALLILFSVSTGLFGQTTTSVKKEIPRYKNGRTSVHYDEIHFHSPALKIDSLENGFDSLALRLWYEWSFEKYDIMLQITKSPDGQWAGTIYKFLAYGPPEMRKDSVFNRPVVPKSGWESFFANINKKQITTLRDPSNIKGFEDGWTDGWSCSIELATSKEYRFYSYHVPEIFQKERWQHKNMVDILNIVEREFGIKWKHH